jgi:hypothetical protein
MGMGADFSAGLGSPQSVTTMGSTRAAMGGTFSDGLGSFGLAIWDGRDWRPIRSLDGTDGGTALSSLWDGTGLIVTGAFDTAAGATVNSVARFVPGDLTNTDDPGTWTGYGTGLHWSDNTTGEGYTLATYGDSLVVGGGFDRAGSITSPGIAQWHVATAPGAPTHVVATAGKTSVSVSWTAPTDTGGMPITGYRVTSSPGAKSCVAVPPTTHCIVTGLTAGSTYRFSVTAANSVGTGPASTASSPVSLLTASVVSYTVTARALFFPGDARVGPTSARALAAMLARIPKGSRVSSVKVTGYVQKSASAHNDAALSRARARATAAWLVKHGVGGRYTATGMGVGGKAGISRSALVVVTYTVALA